MDVEKIIATIKEKTGLSDEMCQKAGDIVAQNFAPGNDNKNKLIGLLVDKLHIDEGKANEIYNAVSEFLAGGVVDKIKGFFGK